MRTIYRDDLFGDLFKEFRRFAIGLEPALYSLKALKNLDQSYPPYNLEEIGSSSSSDYDITNYRITMAVAGFTANDIEIEDFDRVLKITGKIVNDENASYVYRGIAARQFSKEFYLAEHISVTSATMENGMLFIDLEQKIPIAAKSKKIAINQPSAIKAIDKPST